jgi:ribose transport system ATP-binding protein
MESIIEFQHITKVFPGQKALDDVSFSVNKGEIHALIGENGAGKSTLLNVLHGVFPPTEGKVLISGKTMECKSPLDAMKYGVVKVPQEICVVPELTVAQNIMLGKEIRKGIVQDKKKIESETQKLLDMIGCNFGTDEKVKDLSTGKKQMVQIAKALHTNAQVISFDESTSSLSAKETETLFHIIESLKERGITILYISHKMDEIYRLCDRATILRDGKYITTVNVKETSEDNLVRYMIGRDVSMFATRHQPCRADYSQIVLKVDNLCGAAGFKNISFELHKGEILGFYGLVGAMRTEVMRGIFGADPCYSGTILHEGRLMPHHRSPDAMIKNGIAMVTENRKEEGFIKTFNNADNIALASIKKFTSMHMVNRKKIAANSVSVGASVGLVPNAPDFMTSALSGGNAQKIILAKWLTTDADILIMDEPTKGIDIGAKAEIYALMEKMVASGKSIIMVSSELSEIMGIADRIIVMREGQITGVMDKAEFAEDKIAYCAVVGGQK